MARIDLIDVRRALVATEAPPMFHRGVVLLVSVAASLIMMLMVAFGALALERATDATDLAADSEPSEPGAVEWCKVINGRTICLGEPS